MKFIFYLQVFRINLAQGILFPFILVIFVLPFNFFIKKKEDSFVLKLFELAEIRCIKLRIVYKTI